MKEILQQINNVDGVIGTALFNEKAELLGNVFPALIDATSLHKAASLTMECSYGLQMAQTLDLLDLRYTDGRIIIKTFPGALLLLLCANNINIQVLSITLNLAIKKLGSKLAQEAIVPATQSANQNSESNAGVLLMNISHLANKQASASFDSLGMIAISQPTFQHISDFYKTPFKKLTLTSRIAGTTGTFPVMVMKDMDLQYDGTVVVGPGIEKKLKLSEGDKVEVQIG